MNKIPKYPNCNNQMSSILYHDLFDGLEEYIKKYKIYYRGIELKEDRNNPNQIKYHCYNCDRSYSKNLEKFVIESDCIEYIEE